MSTTIDTDIQDGILTIDQAAAYLAIPKATLYTWRTRRPGFGPRAVKLGGCLRYRRADLDAWVAEHVETLDDIAGIPEQRVGDGVSLQGQPAPSGRVSGMGRGRPPTAVGTWGTIRTRRVREGAYRSRTRIRDKDGVTREVTATGTTSASAERALRQKLVDRQTPTQQGITADTAITKLATTWLAFPRDEGRIEATTINEYERVLTKVVIPELGGLRLREVTTSRLDLFLVRLRAVSASRQRKTKVVLGAMLGLAVRHDALPINPVQQTSRIHREKNETRSLTLEDLTTVREAVRAWTTKQRSGPKATTDMADIIDLMLATGARIGEILALRWVDIDLDAARPAATINGTIKTEPGKGTYRKASPKSDASVRTVVLPDFAIAMLQRRRSAAGENPPEAVFPTRNGTWQQVNNVERRWRPIRHGTGLDWVTPHTFRKTVATLIPERVGAETASQQLGHSSPAITREFYISKPAIAADVAHLLDELGRSEPSDDAILRE